MNDTCTAPAAPVPSSNGAAEGLPRLQLREVRRPSGAASAGDETQPRTRLETRNIDPTSPPFVAEPNATAVVVGPGRSGTTMTVGVLERLGIAFGDGTDELGEDIELNAQMRAFTERSILWRLPTARRTFRTTLDARRRRWGRFGFKTPHLGRSLVLAADLIEQPVYIFVLRNPFHIARSWKKTHSHSLTSALPGVILSQYVTAAFLARTRRPVVMFSYEDALAHPGELCTDLSNALGLDPSKDALRQAADFVAPTRGYRDSRRFVGHIDSVSENRVCGWVSDLTKPHEPVTVDLYVGDTRVGSGLANGFRSDVLEKGYHATGHCGFERPLSRPLSPHQYEDLTVAMRDGPLIFRYGTNSEAGCGHLTALPSNSARRGGPN